MNKEEMMIPFVMEQLENGLRNGYYGFEDKSMTLEKWLELPSQDRLDKYKIGLTQKGKEEAPSRDLLKTITNNDFTDRYIKGISEKDGEVRIELTDRGERAKMLAVAMGLDFAKIISNMMKDGIRKQFNQLVIIDKLTDGQTRR